jgi:thiamine pyrophosphokinase
VKDATDLELALALAAARDPGRIVVAGSAEGRLDHLVGGLMVLAAPSWAGVDASGIAIEAYLGPHRVTVIRRRTVLTGAPGELLSLVPAGGPVRGIRTAGLLYPLRDETLPFGASRGISNEFTAAEAVVTVRDGTLLAIRPGPS